MNQTINNRNLKVGGADVRVALYEDTEATIETAMSVGRLTSVTGRYTGDRITYEADNGEDIDGGIANEQYEVGASEWLNIDLEVLHLLLGEVGVYKSTSTEKTLSIGGGGVPKALHVWLVNTQADGHQFIVEIFKCTTINSAEFSYGNDKQKSQIRMPITLIGKPDPTRPAGEQLVKITDEVTISPINEVEPDA